MWWRATWWTDAVATDRTTRKRKKSNGIAKRPTQSRVSVAHKTPTGRRSRRLHFSPTVLVAEYVPKRYGISPGRAEVPLDAMVKQQEARQAEEAAALAAAAPKRARKQQARAQAMHDELMALLAQDEADDAAAPAAPEGRRRRREPTADDLPQAAKDAASRLAALIAAELQGGGVPAAAAATAAAAVHDAAAHEAAARGGGLDACASEREALLWAAEALVRARSAILAGAALEAAEAIDELSRAARRALAALLPPAALARLRKALDGAMRQVGTLLDADVEERYAGSTVVGGAKRPAAAAVRALLGVDAAYFALVYHDVTAAEPRRTLDVGTASLVAACAGGGGGGDAGDEVIVAPAAFLVRSWPDGCEERWRAKLEALAAGAQAGGAPPPNGGPVRRGWVAAAAHEQAVQLAAATAAWRAGAASSNTLLALWGARWLEAAALLGGRGAFDDLIAQEPPPPRGPPEVGAEPPAPPLLRRWRRAEREWPCWLLAFAVPSEAALGRLAALSPLVEMGAGTAFWAAALARRGATVDCFDCDPPHQPAASEGGGGGNEFHGDCPAYALVVRGGASLLAQPRWKRHTLFLCYPPPSTSAGGGMAAEALRAFSGDTIAHVGEWRGDTGDAAFERDLAAGWRLVERLPLPTWGDTCEDLTIWKRHAGASGGGGGGAHPVLACDTCGAAGSVRPLAAKGGGARLLRRCRYCRLACFCSAACERAGSEAHERYHALKLVTLRRPLDFDGRDFHDVCPLVAAA